jgi:G:T-mismatch repair DNA endonuclease (very short patch repair protein)
MEKNNFWKGKIGKNFQKKRDSRTKKRLGFLSRSVSFV